MKGILVSYTPGDIAAYAVTLNAQGHEVSREKIRAGGGQARFVANADGTQPNAAPGRGAGAGRGAAPWRRAAARQVDLPAGGRGWSRRRARAAAGAARCRRRRRAARAGMPEGYTNPYTTPTFEFKPNDWNNVEVEVEANLLRGWLNGGS